jgi:hypothetical protein
MYTPPVNPLQKRSELGRAQLHHPITRVRPDEAPAVQAFIEKTHPVNVMPEQLHPITAAASKNIELPGEWIG